MAVNWFNFNKMKNLSLIITILIGVFFVKNGNSQCSNPPSYNDPESQTGNLEAMNIPCAWTITNGSPNIAVAVVDDFLDDSHVDLIGKVVEIVGPCDPAQGEYHHGNQSLGAVAGIRNNGHCIAGSGGLTKVAGFCQCATNTSLIDVMNKGYKIISISCWGSLSKATMETLTQNGVVVLLAGLSQHFQANDPNGLHSVPGVIHCGRARMNGDFNQYGSFPNKNLDVLAVTEGIWRLQPGNSCSLSETGGTSIGTPHIAGVVALMMDVNPCLTPSDYEEILVATSLPIPANAPAGTTRGGIIDAYAAVLMAQNFQGIDKIWSGVQTISMDQVSGNLIVESGADILMDGKLIVASNRVVTIQSGARLEVTGTVELGEDTKIIIQRGAEMIVNGGTITNATGPNDCFISQQWGSIVVEGNANQPQQLPGNVNDLNGNGVLHLIDAIIENGHTMITMEASHIPWPQTKEYWGGHVTATNTVFRNTNNFTNYARVAAFMQYHIEDRSKFTNCTITNVTGGMTHWSNHGVTYSGNNFDTYQRVALLTYDAAIKVHNGNTFDNSLHNQYDQAAIDLYQTYPISNQTTIGSSSPIDSPNQFYGGYHSIYSEGGFSTDGPIRVTNNIFTGGQYNMYFSGVSRHVIENNDMIGPVFGTTLVANGSQYNTQRDNQFSSNDVGIFTFYNNSGYDFLSNCFDYTDNRDVRLHGNIVFNQGNHLMAASNTFSQSTTTRRIVMSGLPIDLMNPHFQYHILENTLPSDRSVPRVFFQTQFGGNSNEVTNIYNVYDSETSANPGCGSTLSPGPVNVPNSNCDIPDICDDIPQFIQGLETGLAQETLTLQSLIQFSSEWYLSKHIITEIQRCIQKAKQKYIFCKGLMQEYEPLKGYFANDELLYQSLVYGMMVENQDYVQARLYLSEISLIDEETIDFVEIQNINLNRLEDYNYSPTAADLTKMESVGLKIYPTSGYARSLYRYLTDIKIELELPYDEGEIAIPRSNGIEKEFVVFISPNPSKGNFTIRYEGLVDGEVSIYDLTGQVLLTRKLAKGKEIMDLDLTNQSSGIYYIIVRDQERGSLIHYEKIVLVK